MPRSITALVAAEAATDLDANRAPFLARIGGVLYLIIMVAKMSPFRLDGRRNQCPEAKTPGFLVLVTTRLGQLSSCGDAGRVLHVRAARDIFAHTQPAPGLSRQRRSVYRAERGAAP